MTVRRIDRFRFELRLKILISCKICRIFYSMFSRVLPVPQRSFFLFGARGTGKSTWLRAHLKNALFIDLLRTDTYFPVLRDPGQLRERVLAVPKSTWIVIDEVQRIPSLLNEVHELIENHGRKFALTGSSARKLKRGQANLLAGRAFVKNLYPLTRIEHLGAASIHERLAYGSLPAAVARRGERVPFLESYVDMYLREEIKEEALTRRIDSFARFLDVAALANANVTNLANISRDAGVPRATVTTYFEILKDTLIGSFLPAWTPRVRVKEVLHPKFYFFDCGVVRAIQGRLRDTPTSEERGHLLETYVHHELRAHISYANTGGDLRYWRTADGNEVDFIWTRGKRNVGIEVKAQKNWNTRDDAGLRALFDSKVEMKGAYGVYLGETRLKKAWGEVLPVDDFLKRLEQGSIIG